MSNMENMISMEQKLPKHLPHPAPVSETEFLVHLDKICENAHLKNLVFGFYRTLKKQDYKGKKLSARSFGLSPQRPDRVQVLTDQALLFSGAPKSEVALDVEFSKSLTRAHKHVQEFLLPRNEEMAEKMLDVLTDLRYAKSQIFFEKHSANKIGQADLFRWQLVNFIDRLTASSEKDGNCAGEFSDTKREIVFYGFEEPSMAKTPKEKEECFFQNKKVVFHELTHLINLKSISRATETYLMPWLIQCGDMTYTLCEVSLTMNSLNGDGVPNADVLECFKDGFMLLNEIATEFCTTHLMCKNNVAYTEGYNTIFKNTPSAQFVFLKPKTNSKGVVLSQSDYQQQAHVFKLLYTLLNAENDVSKTTEFFSVDKQFQTVQKFLSLSKLSPEVSERLNRNLATRFNLSGEVLAQEDKNFDKFVLLLGAYFQECQTSYADPTYRQKTGDFCALYGETAQILQAVIIDAHKNAISAKMDEIVQTAKTPAQAKTALAGFVGRKARLAEMADEWVLKLTNRVVIGDEKKDLARNLLPNVILGEISENNFAMQTWADYVEFLTNKVYEHAPILFSVSPFWKKEAEALDLKITPRKKDIKNKENFEK